MSGRTFSVPPRDRFTVSEEDLNELMEKYGAARERAIARQHANMRWIAPFSIFVGVLSMLFVKSEFRQIPGTPPGTSAALVYLGCVVLGLWTVIWLPWNLLSEQKPREVTKDDLVADLRERAKLVAEDREPLGTGTSGITQNYPASTAGTGLP